MKFSANLGFLWTELPLPDAIRKAHQAGFDAVEFHWPYDTPVEDVLQALSETSLPVLGLNTRRGNLENGENGLSALPGREIEARAAIDEAIHYASQIGAGNIHVMAGFADGEEADRVFVENLIYACDSAKKFGLCILIEPLNHYDAPGYYLSSSRQAADIIATVARSNLKLMFDCYHMQLMEGDVSNRLKSLLPIIGHIQIASVPERAAPDRGELHYPFVLSELSRLGHAAPIGAEFKPGDGQKTDDHLDWLVDFQRL